MEMTARRSSGIGALVFGYSVLAAATVLYGSLVYIAAIGFKESIPGVSQGPLDFIRHVILVPGLFPWLLTATWVGTLHFDGRVMRGLGFVTMAVLIHYAVFAISAHDDTRYLWAQGIEILFVGYCSLSLIRRVAKRPAP